MCFDCSCDSCGYAFGNVIYIFERLASCCAMTAVVTCLIATLMVMLGMGVGLGYNYCFVDSKFSAMKPSQRDDLDAADIPASFRREGSRNQTKTTTTKGTTEGDSSLQRIPEGKSFNWRRKMITESNLSPQNVRRVLLEGLGASTVSDDLEIKPTMVVPMRKVNLLSLITRLRENNKNVTLELIQ